MPEKIIAQEGANRIEEMERRPQAEPAQQTQKNRERRLESHGFFDEDASWWERTHRSR